MSGCSCRTSSVRMKYCSSGPARAAIRMVGSESGERLTRASYRGGRAGRSVGPTGLVVLEVPLGLPLAVVRTVLDVGGRGGRCRVGFLQGGGPLVAGDVVRVRVRDVARPRSLVRIGLLARVGPVALGRVGDRVLQARYLVGAVP